MPEMTKCMVHSLSGIVVIFLSWKLAIAVGHDESDSRAADVEIRNSIGKPYHTRLTILRAHRWGTADHSDLPAVDGIPCLAKMA